jgi:hypothetical protein
VTKILGAFSSPASCYSRKQENKKRLNDLRGAFILELFKGKELRANNGCEVQRSRPRNRFHERITKKK